MCGIVAGVAQREVASLLLEGLRRLEYRGYDSAGMAVLNGDGELERLRTTGKVAKLARAIDRQPLKGVAGIAHTRWATHGRPSESNAHPHICRNRVAVVHNGIIENHARLRDAQKELKFPFTSDTDTEVIAHQVYHHLDRGSSLLQAVQRACGELEGSYALGVVSTCEPGRLIAVRRGSPLVIGLGIGEYFIASDVTALLSVTRRFVFLHDGDVVDLTSEAMVIYDQRGERVERPETHSQLSTDIVERGAYRHYMRKEIYEQPRAIADTLEGRIHQGRVLEEAFGVGASELFDRVQGVLIIACGSSYHAGLIGRYWMESLAGIPCSVEVASEFRYRRPVVRNNSLIVTISQSGETADTLAALREVRRQGFGQSLAICNVPESSLIRESEMALMTRAGPEIGVASTKAFTTQLVVLMLLTIVLGRRFTLDSKTEQQLAQQLLHLPHTIEDVLQLDDKIQHLSERFADKQHALFVGRGAQYPVAMEGALKLKEISYIHAEAYPAGELKHGPLALIDAAMPVIAVAPNNKLLEKLKSNLQEVAARGGEMLVFADRHAGMASNDASTVLPVAPIDDCVAPIVYTVPLQLLAYNVAVLKGTDVDQPRNLAKSVTVE